jgi:hypothetical protein
MRLCPENSTARCQDRIHAKGWHVRATRQFLTLGRHEPGPGGVMLGGRESEYGLILYQARLAYLAKLMRDTSAK